MPFQFTTGFGVGSERRTGESLNIQPVLPFSLTSGWSVVALPSLSVTYEPPPDEEFGLQDLPRVPPGLERASGRPVRPALSSTRTGPGSTPCW